MVEQQVDGQVVANEPVEAAAPTSVRAESRRITTTGPSGPELARRVIILVFGLIQIAIGARIILLLIDAREGNALVAGILNISQLVVAPFEGILQADSLSSAGSVLDIAAIVALVAWTILELIVIWSVGIFRRSAA